MKRKLVYLPLAFVLTLSFSGCKKQQAPVVNDVTDIVNNTHKYDGNFYIQMVNNQDVNNGNFQHWVNVTAQIYKHDENDTSHYYTDTVVTAVYFNHKAMLYNPVGKIYVAANISTDIDLTSQNWMIENPPEKLVTLNNPNPFPSCDFSFNYDTLKKGKSYAVDIFNVSNCIDATFILSDLNGRQKIYPLKKGNNHVIINAEDLADMTPSRYCSAYYSLTTTTPQYCNKKVYTLTCSNWGSRNFLLAP